jgi:hypothetical protein
VPDQKKERRVSLRSANSAFRNLVIPQNESQGRGELQGRQDQRGFPFPHDAAPPPTDRPAESIGITCPDIDLPASEARKTQRESPAISFGPRKRLRGLGSLGHADDGEESAIREGDVEIFEGDIAFGAE